MAYPELTLLGRFTNTNASTGAGKAANGDAWSPAPVQTTEPNLRQGLLTGKQVGEVAFCVAYSPVDSAGGTYSLPRVRLVLDGTPYEYIQFDATQGTNMQPPQSRIRHGVPWRFGRPTLSGQIGANGLPRPSSLIEATCPKFLDSVSVQAYPGSADILVDYTIDVWGYVYDSILLAKQMPVYDPADVAIPDPANGRSYIVRGHPIAADGDWRDHWLELPSGSKQSVSRRPSDGQNSTQVFALGRRASNSNVITTQSAYTWQYQNSSDSPAVARASDNLYFKLSKSQALLLQRMGVVGPVPSGTTDLLSAWIDTASQSQPRHPLGGIPAGYNRNELRYGLVRGQTNLFDAVPFLPQGEQLVTDETAFPAVIATGASLAADSVNIALTALYFNNGSGGTI